MILSRAKDCYENNIELLRQSQKINTENYLKRKKIKKERMEKKYQNISEENRKKLKEYQKIIVRLKKMLHKCKYVNESALQRRFLFVLLLIFER